MVALTKLIFLIFQDDNFHIAIFIFVLITAFIVHPSKIIAYHSFLGSQRAIFLRYLFCGSDCLCDIFLIPAFHLVSSQLFLLLLVLIDELGYLCQSAQWLPRSLLKPFPFDLIFSIAFGVSSLADYFLHFVIGFDLGITILHLMLIKLVYRMGQWLNLSKLPTELRIYGSSI